MFIDFEIFLLVKSILFLSISAVTSNVDTEINKNDENKQLLNIIKEDLRRNNDDYIEMLTKNTSNPYLDTKILKNATPEGVSNIKIKDNLINDKNRRAFDDSFDNEDLINIKTQETKYPKRFTKITKLLTKTQPLTKSTKKKINEDKLQRAKLSLEKNKGLLKDFINKKKIETLKPTLTFTKEIRMKARESIEERTLPNGDQIDMAPAKGGRVYAMRIKGRLCQRNVLMPEGPKYDSKGNIYLEPFSPEPGQDYAKTKPPKIILPRCCNCCKKSVLGCE